MHQDTPTTIGLRQRLQNVGKPLNLSQNDMMRLYFLDGLLRRLAASSYHAHFVLGGALFLFKSVLGANQTRLTQDSDFAVQNLPNDSSVVQVAMQTIVAISDADGLKFDPASVLVAPIMIGNPQLGLQVRITGYLRILQEIF